MKSLCTVLVMAVTMAVPSFVWSATTYYVSASTGADGNDGMAPGTAFETISNALFQASSGDTILVDDGTYPLTVELVMDKALTLRSINGRDAAEIQQTVDDNRVVNISAAGAELSGFRITANAWTPPVNSTIYGLGVNLDAAATVTNCIITGASGGGQNKSVYGGGIHVHQGGLVVDCIISNNVMTGAWGGGIAVRNGTMDRCIISGNSAGVNRYGGGAGCGVYMYDNASLVQNCLIVNNTSYYYNGAGVFLKRGTLQNCTIAGNSGPASGAGLYQNGGTALNLIISGNSPDDVEIEGGTITYSCAPDLLTGDGNVFMPPGFVNAAAGDYNLSAGSPCIDAGTDTVGLSYDLALVGRPADGDADSTSTTDMGCYEYQVPGAGLWCRFDGSPTSGTNSLETTFSAVALRDGAPATVTSWDWDFGDTGTGSGQAPAHTYATPGEYTVELTVNDASGSVTLTRTGLVHVVTADTYVSGSGGNVFPYTSWTDAATNIHDALVAATLAAEAGAAPSTIHLTNEVYALTGRLVLDGGIAVVGCGPSETSLRQGIDLAGCVWMTHADAVLQDLTVTNGNYVSHPTIGSVNGLGVKMADGLITNCVLEGNNGGSQNYVVNGGGVYVGGGLLIDSVMRGNTGGMNGYGAYLQGGTVDRCLITENDGGVRYRSSGGIGAYVNGAATLQNCLVVSNTSAYMGGAGVKVTHDNAVVQNCTIVDNSIDDGGETGGGVYMTKGTLRNAILYGNTAGASASDLNQSGGTVVYSCIPTSVSGDGNILTDPAFVDYAQGDYHLTNTSPCVDTGTNIAEVVTDLESVARPADGDLNGTATTDMGCYEYVMSLDGLLCSFDIDGAASGIDTAQVAFTSSVLQDGLPPDTNSVNYLWDFGDGDTLEGLGEHNPTHTYTTTGVFTVSMLVSLDGDTQTFSRADCVSVYADNVYVAAPGVGGHVFPYNTSAKAATNMAAARIAAVGAADSGAAHVNLIVYAGTYELDSELLLDRPITMRSTSGPDATTLEAITPSRVVHITDTNVVLNGFTITGGNLITTGNGAGILMDGGVVTNCVITGNRGGKHAAVCYGAGVYMSGGLVVDSSICNSSDVAGNSQMGSAVFMTGGMLDRCIVTNNLSGASTFGGNGGAGISMNNAQAVVRNSLIAHNESTTKRGGGVYLSAGTIDNCTIVDNDSNTDGGGEEGGGIWVNAAGTARNLIVYGNRSDGAANDVYDNGGTVTYSCAPELSSGEGNITTAPSFEDFPAGDFRVTGAPTVNAGTNLAWITASMLDLDGMGRLQSTTVDMGCYEWRPPSGTVVTLR